MRSFSFLLLFALSFSFVSCQEDEKPSSVLIGTWEKRVYVDSLRYWFVDSYQFKNDSIFDLEFTVRETETGPDLGYRMIGSSWYNLEGNRFKFYYSDVLMYRINPDDRNYFSPREELVPAVVDFFRIPTGNISFSSDLRQFTYQEDCIQFDPNSECLQIPSETFVRVD